MRAESKVKTAGTNKLMADGKEEISGRRVGAGRLPEKSADEVAVGGEIGGGVAVFIEHLVLLLGGALDFLEGGDEIGGGLAGEVGGGLGVFLGLAGFAGALAGFLHHGVEAVQIEGGDVLLVESGGGDGFAEGEVFELAVLIITASGWGGGGWFCGRSDRVGHGSIGFFNSYWLLSGFSDGGTGKPRGGGRNLNGTADEGGVGNGEEDGAPRNTRNTRKEEGGVSPESRGNNRG